METYPNVYADFSCHNISSNGTAFKELLNNTKNAHVFDRLLFGTDWYMTMVAISGKGYKQFCEEYWELIENKDLWLRFTFLNPFEFFGFNEENRLKNLNNCLFDLIAEDDDADSLQKEREKNYSSFKRILKEYSKLKEDLGDNNAK
jgi:hypothetical protein